MDPGQSKSSNRPEADAEQASRDEQAVPRAAVLTPQQAERGPSAEVAERTPDVSAPSDGDNYVPL